MKIAVGRSGRNLSTNEGYAIIKNRPLYVGITLRLTHTVQFSSDLVTWSNVVEIPVPTLWTNLPAPGQKGFYRDVTAMY